MDISGVRALAVVAISRLPLESDLFERRIQLNGGEVDIISANSE